MNASREIKLPAGTIRYRDTGSGEPVVFVHGLLVDGTLWRKVVPLLEHDVRCIVPDWPLGSHTIPMKPDADLSPRGQARIIASFLEALDLEGVTIVANDTGGAISQLLVTELPQRIGRLVLTSCDAYDNFFPPMFRPLTWASHVPGLLTAIAQPMRMRVMRRLPMGYGMVAKRRVPDEITDGWLAPFFSQRAIRRDTAKLLRGVHRRDTLAAAKKFGGFDRPVLVAWAQDDRVMKAENGRRLAADFPKGRLELVADSYTFIPEDQPERLAQLIAGFVREPYAGSQEDGSTPAGVSPTLGGK